MRLHLAGKLVLLAGGLVVWALSGMARGVWTVSYRLADWLDDGAVTARALELLVNLAKEKARGK